MWALQPGDFSQVSRTDPAVAFVHAALVESDDDIVALLTGRHWGVDRADREYVGEDGYLTPSEFDDRLEHVRSVFESFVYK